MKVSFDLPEGFFIDGLSGLPTRKGAIEWHAYVRSGTQFRGGAFTFDPQSAVDSAVKNLRDAQLVKAPTAPPRFTLDLSGLTRRLSNGRAPQDSEDAPPEQSSGETDPDPEGTET